MKLYQLCYQENMQPETVGSLIAEAAVSHHLVHVVGVPFREEALAAFYEAATAHIGECLNLGETVGSKEQAGKWTHVCYDPAIKNAYRSSANAQPLHTDGAYIAESPDATCMYCISAASEGGGTIFITAEALIQHLEEDNPQLLKQLLEVPVCFSRDFVNASNQKIKKIIEMGENGKITLTWNYHRVDKEQSPAVLAMCENFHDYLQTKVVGSERVHTVYLKPGEAVLWLDERVLHGRNAFSGTAYGVRNLAKVSLNLNELA